MNKKKKVTKAATNKKSGKRTSAIARKRSPTSPANEKTTPKHSAVDFISKVAVLRKKRPVLLTVSGLCIVALIAVGIIIYRNTVKDNSAVNLNPANGNTSNIAEPLPVNTPEIEISDTTVTDITETSLTVTWKTNVPATGELMAEDQESDTSVSSWPDNNLDTEHEVVLEGLQPSTAYSLIIKSTDASGNMATFESDYPYQTLTPHFSTDIVIGQASPDFSLETLNGDSIRLSDFKGKWVMLVFWMTTCNGCREELPHLNSFWLNSGLDDFVLLTVNVAGQEAITRSYVEGQNLSFPVLLDQERKVYDEYSVAKFPTAFLISPDGTVKNIKEEILKNEADINAFVSPALKAE